MFQCSSWRSADWCAKQQFRYLREFIKRQRHLHVLQKRQRHRSWERRDEATTLPPLEGLTIREVVITSVLEEDPRGAMQDATCLISQIDKIYWPQNLSWDFHIRCAWSLHCWRNDTGRFESFLCFYSWYSGGYTNKSPSFKVGEGGYMKRPLVFLQSGGSCLSTIVLTISLIAVAC